MPKPMKRARVEPYKVSGERKTFARTYRRMKRIGEMLRNDAFGVMLQARGARDAHADWLAEFQGMVKGMPPEKIKELAQQPEAPEAPVEGEGEVG